MEQIDFTAIAQPETGQPQEDWEPPRHVFFGPKDERGKAAKEPVYKYLPFPQMIYGKEGDKLRAVVVNSEAEKARYVGYSDTPATFGYIGAPTFDEAQAMKELAALEKAKAEQQALADAALMAGAVAEQKKNTLTLKKG
jgi:hypothetical protein